MTPRNVLDNLKLATFALHLAMVSSSAQTFISTSLAESSEEVTVVDY
jgi:hypothetical protein